MVTAQDIVVSARGTNGVATVTLNRPAKRNAVSLAMWRRLAEIFSELGGRNDVRAIILTGAGGNFCAGADISEFSKVRADAEIGSNLRGGREAATLAIRDCRKPTIAAISGYAMGGGCGLALACDFRVGDAHARMGIPAARLGIVYGELDCALLTARSGLRMPSASSSGPAFSAEDCVAMGLVDMVATEAALAAARRPGAGDRRQRATLGRGLQADPRGWRRHGRSAAARRSPGHRSKRAMDKRGLSRRRASLSRKAPSPDFTGR